VTEQSGSDYYLVRKPNLLKGHDKVISAGKSFAVSRYRETFAETLARESREEFEKLIPQIPYTGGKENPLTDNLVRSASSLAIYRSMQRRGKTVGETGELIYRAYEVWMKRRFPGFVGRLVGRLWITRVGRRRFERQARRSQQRQFPDDWVFEFIEGDGETFDWGMDFSECGIVKFYHSQGADELAPYLCLVDFAMFKALGVGLRRTETLAGGWARCNVRFKKDQEPLDGWPPKFLKKQGDTSDESA
jgi:hypothetical protein